MLGRRTPANGMTDTAVMIASIGINFTSIIPLTGIDI